MRSGWRAGFREWRRSRPFWAGVWTLLAGLEIVSIPLAPLALMIHEGIAGVSGMLMGIFLVILALTLWIAPHYRVFAGIATLVFAIASLVLSNFGGFLFGFLLAALGGAMAVSWAPDGPEPEQVRQPGLNWPHPDGSAGTEGPSSHEDTGTDSGGTGPDGPAGSDEPAADGPRGAHGLTERSSAVRANNRLRALGVLPAGGALLAGGLHPVTAASAPVRVAAKPAASAPARVAAKPTPSAGADQNGGPGMSVCSLLDGLLVSAGPRMRSAGSAGLTSNTTGTDSRVGVHPSTDATLPGQRRGNGRPSARPTPSPTQPRPRAVPSEPARGGGLLGAVSGLIGLNTPHPEASSPHPAPPRLSSPGPGGRVARPAPLGPVLPDPATSGKPGAGTGDSDSPSLLRLALPPLPLDHGMDGLLSSLPLQLKVGSADPQSPWCLPKVSLRLSLGAAVPGVKLAAAQPFRVRTPLLSLTGLTYHGITDVPTNAGPQRVLVFTAARVDIASLRQTAPLLAPGCGPVPPGFPHFHGLPGIRLPLLDMGLPGIGLIDPSAPGPWAPCQGTLETDAAPGSTTTASGGPVLLLTKVLSGKLLGLLPVTFTPDMPPPLPPGLTLPIPLVFTDVTAYNQYLSTDGLTVPGLHQTASR
jgi:hypothetical protein